MMMMGGIEMLMMLFFAGGPLGDLLGLPPGERDTALVHAAAEDSVFYLEWASRGSGTPGAEGIDGLVADPEVAAFFQRLESAVTTAITGNLRDDPARELMAALPGFVIAFSGRPGCLHVSFADGDPPANADPGLGVMMSLKAALVINGGDSADKFAQQLAGFMAPLGINAAADFNHTPLPLPIPAEIHRHENYFILAVGPRTADEVANRLKESAGGLADNKDFSAALEALLLERTGSVAWLDLENGVEDIAGLMGPPGQMIPDALDMVGLGGVRNVVSVIGVVDGQVQSRVVAKTDGKLAGLMAMGAGRAMTAKDFSFVPADSDLVVAFSFDAQKILTGIREMVSRVDPGEEDDWDRTVTEFEDTFGLNVQKDIIDAFGHVVTISNSPGDGGWLATSPVLTLEVRKPAGAFKTVAKFAEFFDRQSTPRDENGRPKSRRAEFLERKEFMGQRIYMMNFVGDDDFIVAPSFAVNRSHLMIALHPQPLKSRLRRMADEANWKTFQFTPKYKGDVICYTFVRTADILEDVYGFLPWIAQSVMSQLQGEGVQMDAFDFPSAQALLPYVGDAQSVIVRTEDGFRIENTAPPFVGSMTTLPVLSVPWLMFGMRAAEPAPFAIEAEPADEAVPQLR